MRAAGLVLLMVLLASVAGGAGGTFWPAWFHDEGGASPLDDLWLEPAGELGAGDGLHLTLWGAPATGEPGTQGPLVVLVLGTSKALTPVPYGGTLIPVPAAFLALHATNYHDWDTWTGQWAGPPYATLNVDTEMPADAALLPVVYVQAFTGPALCSNGVALDFPLYAAMHP